MNIQADFTGYKAIVTGGTTGIGRAIAYRLAEAGAQVLIAGRDQTLMDDTLAGADAAYKKNIKGVIVDLAKENDITRLFDEADQWLGGLNLLVNNAALAANGIMETDQLQLRETINTNLTAYLICTRMAVNRMQRVKAGHIVNIGSMSADVREKDSSVYVATKAGIQGFSESVRKEISGLGIKVSLIEPGSTDTDMQPGTTGEKAESQKKKEMMDANDVASAVLYAISQPLNCDVVSIQLRPHLQLI